VKRVSRLLLGALLSGSIASSACAAARIALSGPSDYHSYRRYRLADSLDERLSAGWAYLRDQPDGEFRAEVEQWFVPAESRFFTEAGRTPGGALAYLKLMPDGPHATEEATFLRAFELEKIEGPLREKRALEEARKKADDARKALGDAIEVWTRRALTITTWGAPLAKFDQVDRAVSDAFADTPKAKCTSDGCSKVLYFTYAVPDASPPQDRVVPLVVRLELAAGVVVAVSITAPKGGFSWWLEGSEGHGVDPFDVNQRAEALMRAKNRVEVIARSVVTSVPCQTSEDEAMRTIVCGTLQTTIAASPTGDDVIRIVGVPGLP